MGRSIKLNLIDESKHALLWVVDFPMFEWSEEEQRFMAMHHPFTSPCLEDLDKLDSGDLGNVKSVAPVVSAWFDDAEVMEFTNDKLVIYSPSDFRKETIRSRCTGHVKNAMKELFDLDVELVVLGEEEMESYRKTKKKLLPPGKKLIDFANGHLFFGFHLFDNFFLHPG